MLKNKNIILTGSSSGIGLAILEALAKNGANIFACARKESKKFNQKIDEFSDKYQIEIIPIYFDFQNEKEIKNAIKNIRNYKKQIDGLVNNAGFIHTSLFAMTPIKFFKDVFEVNYFSQMLFLQYIVKFMIKDKSGSIVNISSSAAIFANKGLSAYASAKSALITSTQVLAKEVGEYNIRVNSIAPGFTDTKLMHSSISQEEIKEELKKISLKRIANPFEIANVALFLLSNMSSYVTGEVIRVDGGMF